MKVASADTRPTIFRRPVQKLYPIEISGKSDQTEETDDIVETTEEAIVISEPKTSTPQRRAAIEASEERGDLIERGLL